MQEKIKRLLMLWRIIEPDFQILGFPISLKVTETVVRRVVICSSKNYRKAYLNDIYIYIYLYIYIYIYKKSIYRIPFLNFTSKASKCLPTSTAIRWQWSSTRGKIIDKGPTCTEFLQMAALTKKRLPHLTVHPIALLCLRDATDEELVHLIHEKRMEWGRRRGLGRYTMQQSVCLHLACSTTDMTSRLSRLENVAKSLDAFTLQHSCVLEDASGDATFDASDPMHESPLDDSQCITHPHVHYSFCSPFAVNSSSCEDSHSRMQWD